MKHITRRGALKGMAAGVAAVHLLGGRAGAAEAAGELPAWKNSDFYKDGKFDAEAAKKA